MAAFGTAEGELDLDAMAADFCAIDADVDEDVDLDALQRELAADEQQLEQPDVPADDGDEREREFIGAAPP